MAIVAADIQTRYSGGAANGDPNASLGGAESNQSFASGVQNNLWDDVTGAESASGDTEYRGFYVHNNNGAQAWLGPVIWIDQLTSSPDTEFFIALAAEGVSVQMAGPLTDEGSAPAGVTFTQPTSKATGLALGNPDLAAGAFRGVWMKRVVNAGAGAFSDSGSFRVEGDTNA